MAKPYAPRGLNRAGRKLWQEITHDQEGWSLRPDELRVLEDAARMADRIDIMENALSKLSDDQLLVKGSYGQPVIHPFIAEIRQARTTVAALLRQLRLAEDDQEGAVIPGTPMSRTDAARKAANARWGKSA